MEYHGWEHAGMCASKTDTASCWYNVDTLLMSKDGGYHFTSPKPPASYLLSLPAKYQRCQGPQGYSVDTNILKVGRWHYESVYAWAWPPNCGQGKGQRVLAEGHIGLVSEGSRGRPHPSLNDPVTTIEDVKGTLPLETKRLSNRRW
jgi:hypothetical protein